MSESSTGKADPGVLGLERYRARLGFWQAIWATLITGGVAVAIPAAVETYKARLDRDKAREERILKEKEIELKGKEIEGKLIDSHQQYISNFLTTALNQDIELRIRFSEYFSYVSDSSRDGWKNFRERLEQRREDTRSQIHQKEKDLAQLRTSSNKLTVEQQTNLEKLERELNWLYAELGYVRKDSNVSAPAVTPTSVTTDPVSIISENEEIFRGMTIDPRRAGNIDDIVGRIVATEARKQYEAVEQATGVPWFAVGIYHHLEAGGNFKTHLNGDPLTARTTHVPQGRPSDGGPPFSWEASAIDLIQLSGIGRDPKLFSSIGGMLYLLERIDGLGYRRVGARSPAIWGCTNAYTRGRFVTDGKFDPNALSTQCGAAPILKVMIDRMIVRL
jgi:lysozyme family protein